MPTEVRRNLFLISILSSLLIIDLFATFGEIFNHQMWAHAACFSLSVGKFSYILIPNYLLDYAQKQCPDAVTYVGAGISFLALKILIMGIFAIGLYIFNLFTKFGDLKYFNDGALKYGGTRNALLVDTGVAICLALFLFAVYLNFETRQYYRPGILHFRSDILFKLQEDFFCIILWSVLLGILQFPTICLYLLSKKKQED